MDPSKQPSYPDLKGRVAFVTGGSRGIGAATCRMLANNGVRVAVNGRDPTAIEGVVRAIRDQGGEAIGSPADCTNSAALADAFDTVHRELGDVDILVAFAGGSGEPTPFLRMSEEKWRSAVDANLTATFLTIRTFAPVMVERRRGAIVTMSSSAGRLPGLASPPYAASKAAVVMLTGHLARELAPMGVRVNCVAPSAIMNDRLAKLPAEKLREIAAGFPLGRLGAPEDVALATLYLVSDSSSWVTGVTLDISGGRIIV
ncbi:MAG TPA: SDR family NAD(P)-dependent oxidoreductase [Polyangiaceae bacterium]|nr:SDR family NAD(P)-dependent oxidoreductase [Polyangiaceae bacterium]